MTLRDSDAPGNRIILASGSPRRRELLGQMGIVHDIVPPNLDESAFSQTEPRDLVRALAEAKCRAVRSSESGASARWVLAADTVVAVNGLILGKPEDRPHARSMIRELSGRKHDVITGIAIWPPATRAPTVEVAETVVSFCSLKDNEIEFYLDSNDWHDVAGGYRIQGRAALYIDWISGSYSNVVGLPIHLVYSILTAHGYQGIW